LVFSGEPNFRQVLDKQASSTTNKEWNMLQASQFSGTVIIPRYAPGVMVTMVRTGANLDHVDKGWRSWDFMGKKDWTRAYQVMIWDPRLAVSSEEVREHFAKLGFHGNNAAFLAWVWNNWDSGSDEIGGCFVTIPDDELLYRDDLGNLCAPDFHQGVEGRQLNLSGITGDWGGIHTFVGFRDITPQR
jgi:hypothetical protein